MKQLIYILIAGLTMTACMNNWDTEQVSSDIVTAENIGEPNTTIQELRKKYKAVIEGSLFQEVTRDVIVEGVVTGNDLSGNIYQKIYIQPLGTDGIVDTSQGGIAVAIKGYAALYAIFPVGQKIRINLKGLYIGGYGSMAQVGQPYITASDNWSVRLGPMTSNYTKTNVQKVSTPFESYVAAKEINSGSIYQSVRNDIDTFTPMLVMMKNVEFPDSGFAYAHADTTSDYSISHSIKFSDGTVASGLLYTSTSATFAGDTIPSGKHTVFGILTQYNGTPQLILRSLNDVIKN